jgi:methyl-accepting chemotaxis protein
MITKFKNLRIRTKIGLTFGLILVFGVGLGSMAIRIMSGVQTETERLVRMYVPEVDISNRIERNSLLTMYNIRGYALSDEAHFLESGRSHLDAVKSTLAEARELANRFEALDVLRREIDDIEGQIGRYEELVDETTAKSRDIDSRRKLLDTAAERYMSNARQYITQQEQLLKDEVEQGIDAAAILERFRKIQLTDAIIYMGNQIRVDNFKAQALGEPDRMVQAMERFDEIIADLEIILSLTHEEQNQTWINEIMSSARQYKEEMSNVREIWLAQRDLNVRREEVGNKVLAIAQETAGAGMDRMINMADTAMASLSGGSRTMILGLCVAAAAGVLLAILITAMITRPIRDIVAYTKRIGNGDLTAEIEMSTTDEIGEMAKDLGRSMGNIREMIREFSDTTNTLSSSSEELAAVSSQMAASAEQMDSQASMVAAAVEQVSSNVGTVASAAEQSSASVSSIASMTEEMSTTFENVAQASRKTSDNVTQMARANESMSSQMSSVASSSEEMTSSLNEVAKNTVEASRISQNARKRTEDVNTRISALVSASKQIGKVVGVIKDIADQTNMLALNATIEAAGAGDAGKGFAVVAGEVKELARQSAEATDEIADQIDQIQTSTDDAVSAIEEINAVINKIAGINEMIASSVEEQTATASEISKSVASTAMTVKDVSANANESAGLVKDIAQSTDETSKTAAEVAQNIDELHNGVKEVARSADEAARGASEISKTIQSIGEASKQTALGASQTDASSQELARMATNLAELVSRFRV